jgi:hypothetical protein
MNADVKFTFRFWAKPGNCFTDANSYLPPPTQAGVFLDTSNIPAKNATRTVNTVNGLCQVDWTCTACPLVNGVEDHVVLYVYGQNTPVCGRCTRGRAMNCIACLAAH